LFKNPDSKHFLVFLQQTERFWTYAQRSQKTIACGTVFLKTNFPMDTNHLKIRLIELIFQTENEQILLQILDILEKQISELSFEQIQELDRRLALLESGKMELIDANTALDEIEKELKIKPAKNISFRK